LDIGDTSTQGRPVGYLITVLAVLLVLVVVATIIWMFWRRQNAADDYRNSIPDDLRRADDATEWQDPGDPPASW
jgi:cbb3-type cytochrome oxidase subunit 3